MNDQSLKRYASEFARIGGKSKSVRKARAAKKNGALGGRPKKIKAPPEQDDK